MDRTAAGEAFLRFLANLPAGKATRIHIFTDADADGLPAAALLLRSLQASGYTDVTGEPRRKFENAWMSEVKARLRARNPEALLLVDLGARPDELLPGVPTLLMDHHAPFGVPPGATLLTSYGDDPTATAGLLAFWCALALYPQAEQELLWLAGISLLSDLGDKAPFPELASAKTQFGVSALKDLTALLNAPRRSAQADAAPALRVLLEGTSPKQLLKEDSADIQRLRAAKQEVASALATARKARPFFSQKHREELGAELVAVRVATPCQVHPLIAQTWRQRFPQAVILGVNTAFRAGYVHFAGRAPAGVPLLHFLRKHTPAGADGTFGGGHDQAAGGALPIPIWNDFASMLGFGEAMQVEEKPQPSHFADGIPSAHEEASRKAFEKNRENAGASGA